jgi:hypothetical protein
MDGEVVYIIVGAGIGLLVTTLTTIATQLFQMLHDERQRKWESQLRDDERNRQIVLDRINLLEQFSLEIVSSLGEISMTLQSAYQSQNIEEILAYYDKIVAQRQSIVQRFPYYSSISQYLGGDVDNSYTELMAHFNDCHSNVSDILRPLRKEPKKQEIEWKPLRDKLYCLDLFPDMLKNLDKLKHHPPNFSKE